jgi:hypothetical protein
LPGGDVAEPDMPNEAHPRGPTPVPGAVD